MAWPVAVVLDSYRFCRALPRPIRFEEVSATDAEKREALDHTGLDQEYVFPTREADPRYDEIFSFDDLGRGGVNYLTQDGNKVLSFRINVDEVIMRLGKGKYVALSAYNYCHTSQMRTRWYQDEILEHARPLTPEETANLEARL